MTRTRRIVRKQSPSLFTIKTLENLFIVTFPQRASGICKTRLKFFLQGYSFQTLYNCIILKSNETVHGS